MTLGERFDHAAPALLAVAVLAAAAHHLSAPVADNDLWGHVLFGRAILDEHGLPPTNRYSYTAPEFPWINHEVLAECAFAMAFRLGGGTALLALKLAVGLLTMLALARAVLRRVGSPLAAALALVLASSLMSWGFLVRPQIFSTLALAWTWERLGAHDRSDGAASLSTLPILFVLWANTHGGVVAGLGVLGVYGLLRGPSLPAERRWPALRIAILCGLALLANPYGTEMLSFLWFDLTRDRPITEWAAVPLFERSFVDFKLALAVVAAGMCLRGRNRTWEIVAIGAGAVMALRHQRHIPLFAVLAAPFLAVTIDRVAERWSALRRGPVHAALVLTVLGWGLSGAFTSARLYATLGAGIYVDPDLYPVRAVRFLERNRLEGNLLLPFDWGEYAIWHLYPRCRVSVDGRYTTAYPLAVLEAAQRFVTGAPGWEESLRDATIVLLDRRQPNAQRLFDGPEWSYVYSDSTALVFVRRAALGARELAHDLPADERPPVFP